MIILINLDQSKKNTPTNFPHHFVPSRSQALPSFAPGGGYPAARGQLRAFGEGQWEDDPGRRCLGLDDLEDEAMENGHWNS